MKFIELEAFGSRNLAAVLPEHVVAEPDVAELVLRRPVLDGDHMLTVVERHCVVVEVNIAGIEENRKMTLP